jgi:hypothetical protein
MINTPTMLSANFNFFWRKERNGKQERRNKIREVRNKKGETKEVRNAK